MDRPMRMEKQRCKKRVCVHEAKEVGGVASTSCGRTDNVSLEGALSAPALPARCLGLRRRRETARQRRAGSERRRGGEAAHTPDRPSLGPPRSPASLRQARRTGQHDQCTVAPLKLGATPARSPQSIRGRPPAAEAVRRRLKQQPRQRYGTAELSSAHACSSAEGVRLGPVG